MTYQQKTPNPYATVQRGDLHLHFMGIKGWKASDNYTTCLVIVPEVEGLHAGYAQDLRASLRRLPVAGWPRITRMKPGQSRFTLVDPDGNSLIHVRQDAPDDRDEALQPVESDTRFGKALRTVARVRDFKNDDAMAAKLIDVTLAKEAGDPFERARLLAARVEIATALGDLARAQAARADIAALPLDPGQRAALAPELGRADELERQMRARS